MLEIHVEDGREAFEPGESVRGTLQWMGDAAPEAVELRLLWYTEGRGDPDAGVARTLHVASPAAVGSSGFELDVPSGPWSCSGRLLSIRWALEAVTRPDGITARTELVVAPGGREVDLTGLGS